MPVKRKRKVMTRQEAAGRLNIIRAQNLQRNKAHHDRLDLADRKRRHFNTETMRMERDRLREASASGPLAQHAEARLEHLVQKIALGGISEKTLRRLNEISEGLI